MRLVVVHSDRPSCYVGLHKSDRESLFGPLGVGRGFFRTLRLECVDRDGAGGGDQDDGGKGGVTVARRRLFVGWAGASALDPGCVEVPRLFAACLGLAEGDRITATLDEAAATAGSVMVQPFSADDWEVVELHAEYIAQHLLAQVGVLMPDLAFPLWIRDQMPVKLRIDARDCNNAECFLLGRDSELVVESKARQGLGTSRSVFFRPCAALDLCDGALELRVSSLARDLEVPACRVHPDEFERLLGHRAFNDCLVWLSLSSQGRGAAEKTGPLLLKLGTDPAVTRQHIIVASCFAEHAGIVQFAVVRVWRCRQVPIYSPRIELVPLRPKDQKTPEGGIDDDSARVERLFQALVRRTGELELVSGSVVQLLAGSDFRADSAGAHLGLSSRDRASVLDAKKGAAVEDLYSGLDISDLYAVDVEARGDGVYEIDLGMEHEPNLATLEPESFMRDLAFMYPAHMSGHGSEPFLARVEFASPVEVRVAGATAPPFVRLTSKALSTGVKLSVVKPAERVESDDEEEGEARKAPIDAVALLWMATPGLKQTPDDSLAEIVRLVPCEKRSEQLDEMKIFSEPATVLRRNLFEQLGCFNDVSEEEVLSVATSPTVPASGGCGGIAIIGASGTGKTFLSRRVCGNLGDAGIMTLEVSCAKLGQPTRKFAKIQEWLQGIFRLACWHAPCVVLLDDLNALCPHVEQGAPNLSVLEDRAVVLADLLLDLFLALRASGSRVAVAATLPDDASLHRSLWRALAFEYKINLRSPQLKERPEILQQLLRDSDTAVWALESELLNAGSLDAWGGQVDGFSVGDLAALVERALVEASVEASVELLRGDGKRKWADPKCVALRHLKRAREGFVPSTMANQTFLTSDVQYADIGGLEAQKRDLLDMLTMPTKYAALVDRAPMRPRMGMMLVGPPGCGKTMLVRGVANETKGLLRFLTVKGPELLSKYIGASEAGVRQVFQKALAAAPSVIFFDEIEALAPKRGGDSTGVTDRTVNQLLGYLDGDDRGRVYVLAATSRPDMVDSALMRPGRFDKIILCDLPTDEEKLQMCEALGAKANLVTNPWMCPRTRKDVPSAREQLREMVARFPRNFTSADVNAIFSTAKIEALNEAIEAGKASGSQPSTPVLSMAHLWKALGTAKASISDSDELRYAKIFASYRSDGPPPRHGAESPQASRVALA